MVGQSLHRRLRIATHGINRPEADVRGLHADLFSNSFGQDVIGDLGIQHKLERRVLCRVTLHVVRVELDRLLVVEEVVVLASVFELV